MAITLKKLLENGGVLSVRASFPEGILGTAPGDPEIYQSYLVEKSRKEATKGEHKATKAEEKEELSTLPTYKTEKEAEEALKEEIKQHTTFFHREDGDGRPFLYNYQVKGFLKDATKQLKKLDDVKTDKDYKEFLRQYKSHIDGLVVVKPRRIYLELPKDKEITIKERPLRAGVRTAEGYKEIVALVRSEMAPVGTEIEFTITTLNPTFIPMLKLCVEYGIIRGLGQWRNAEFGRFTHEVIKMTELKKKAKKKGTK